MGNILGRLSVPGIIQAALKRHGRTRSFLEVQVLWLVHKAAGSWLARLTLRNKLVDVHGRIQTRPGASGHLIRHLG